MKFISEFRRLIDTNESVPKASYFGRRFAMAFVLAVLCMSHAVRASAQERTDSRPFCGDDGSAAQQHEDSTAPPTPVPTPAPTLAPALREATWRKLPGNFLQDQKNIWLFPVKLGEGHHWLPTALIVGGTAGLIAADPHTMPHFRQTNAFSGFN